MSFRVQELGAETNVDTLLGESCVLSLCSRRKLLDRIQYVQ
jgi:hypothetical protein